MRVNLSNLRSWCLAFVCAVAIPLSAYAEDLAGTVSFVVGDAVAKADKSAGHAIARGDKILAGEVIETGANGHVHLKMVDGAFVSIRPQSRFRIEEYHTYPKDHGYHNHATGDTHAAAKHGKAKYVVMHAKIGIDTDGI